MLQRKCVVIVGVVFEVITAIVDLLKWLLQDGIYLSCKPARLSKDRLWRNGADNPVIDCLAESHACQ